MISLPGSVLKIDWEESRRGQNAPDASLRFGGYEKQHQTQRGEKRKRWGGSRSWRSSPDVSRGAEGQGTCREALRGWSYGSGADCADRDGRDLSACGYHTVDWEWTAPTTFRPLGFREEGTEGLGLDANRQPT